ncbi:ferredoxin [Gordonia sp. VNK1]|jgi:ferredoxin|uniref:ferredoxin n=1 Tax=Gordonia oleivorans TaxID=3156618 RepID=UPI0032B617A0
MSWLTSLTGRAGTDESGPAPTLVVDRIACTGRGICAHLLPESIHLDEWGYPIIVDEHPDPRAARTAMSLCPTGALHEIRQERQIRKERQISKKE